MSSDDMAAVRFSPEINLGHILTAVTIVLTVGVGGISAYVSVRTDIAAIHAEIATVKGEIGMKIAADEQKAADLSSIISETKSDQKEMTRHYQEAIDNFSQAVQQWRETIGHRR